ncbi:type II toxin-antitoxin system PemK/MazF family toxin [Nocardioides sp. HDW12B]|uniref:type II toxin-antitoxin system PemK/MazF family toxin n=1 Tax=Nocardioides sp. HDW12B TaxID=2714939 RepID=UPI001F0FEEB4|nr:type II toxin-antitoxin system PemK/MazF family toxin [Nocardioides sp. HDW12B]
MRRLPRWVLLAAVVVATIGGVLLTDGGDSSESDSSERNGSMTTYSPEADGLPDPGEVVWTWVPYEEDASQGKDRPVVVLARAAAPHPPGQLLCLQLTSQDHDRDAEDEARWGRYWMDVGSGDWDPERRPSEVRLDRLLVLPEAEVRREGAALERSVFDAVVTEASRHHPELSG